MSVQRGTKRVARPLSSRNLDIRMDLGSLGRAPVGLEALAPPEEDDESDTLIDVLSSEILDAFDFADARGLTKEQVLAAAERAACEEAETTAYQDGLRVDLLEIHSRSFQPAGHPRSR